MTKFLIWFIIEEILLEIGFIEEMRTTLGNNEVPQIFPPIPLSRENTIYSVPICDDTTGMSLQKFFAD